MFSHTPISPRNTTTEQNQPTLFDGIRKLFAGLFGSRQDRRRHSESDSALSVVQTLEQRRVLSAATSQVYNGNLYVNGTSQHDVIHVYHAGNNPNYVWVASAANGSRYAFQRYASRSIRYIVIQGGHGNDTLYNWTSISSVIAGNSGNDRIAGGHGADWLWGGSGNDTIWGQNGNDEIHGGYGNDYLYAGAGDDRIFGEGHRDVIYGQDGDDALIGGVGANDYLVGGSGDDRFLTFTYDTRHGLQSEETVADRGRNDAVVHFRNLPAGRVNLSGFGSTYYAAGNWTDGQIATIDVALGNIQKRVGNTRLLKRADGRDLIMERVGRLSNNASVLGWNGNGSIAFADASFRSAMTTQYVTYHEIGHNWDQVHENRTIRQFQAISGWDQVYHRGDTASTFTGDNWYFRANTSDFARSYGMSNPYEDYATTWETYFTYYYHGTTLGNRVVRAKFAALDAFFATMV